MVRNCAVNNCNETDTSLLSHRFPKSKDIAETWRGVLGLTIPLCDLQRKFVVCTKHFATTAYRNVISNSLNTTAIPGLGANLDNERIFTTRPALKKELDAPTRCHKTLASPMPADPKFQQNKRLKLDGNAEVFVTTPEPTTLNPAQEVIDGFEIYHLSDTQQSEEEILDETLAEQDRLLVKSDQEVQTDPVECEPTHHQEGSKDDKLISILYPEFQNFSKIQLIELLAERNRKIESLEEKVQKLDQAMRELL